jgi:formamidopyrimidine-DNA glycosylase
MPELPEVETVRGGLAHVLEGQRLAEVIVRRPDLRFPMPDGLQRRVKGRRVVSVGRRAKFLLIRLEGDLVLICHLGMSGRFRIWTGDSLPPQPHDHMEFRTGAGVTVRYHDPRRFGFVDLAAAGDLGAHPMLAKLGPEPLEGDFTGAYLADQLTGRHTSVKAAILDQRVVAGMGNIYACESLFRAGLSPRRMAATVVGKRAERLVRAIRDVLADAIAAGGSSLRDHRQPSGELGYFQHRFAVYGRAGRPCPGCACDLAKTGGVQRIVQAGRSTFYCAKRQR